MGQRGHLLLYIVFGLFITIFTTNICEKSPSSIWCGYLNPRPSEHESPPITTRPMAPALEERSFMFEFEIFVNAPKSIQFSSNYNE